MARLLSLPLLLLLVAAAHAQDAPTPLRDAHIVTVSRSDGGGFVFEIMGQQNDFEANLNPGGTLVVVATDGLRVMAVTEDRGYYRNHDDPTNRPLLVGPNAIWIDGRRQDEVGVLKAVSDVPRGSSPTLDVSFLVCTVESPDGECAGWAASRPQRRMMGQEGIPAGLDAGLFVRIFGGPVVYSPAPPDPPGRPVRD